MSTEFNARCCVVCNGPNAFFGFAPPLTSNGATVWACGAHRVEVDRQLTAAQMEKL